MVDTKKAKNEEELKDIMKLEHDRSILTAIKHDIINIENKIAHLEAQLERLCREKSRAEKSISQYRTKYGNDPHVDRGIYDQNW